MREWLRSIRKLKGLSEMDVAAAIGVKQPVYHRYETGQGRPSPEKAQRLGRFLGFDWTLFFPEEPADDRKRA